MDADKYWLIKDFIGENKVLFKIPVYQRNYDWAESNCIRLLDDIKHILDSGQALKPSTFWELWFLWQVKIMAFLFLNISLLMVSSVLPQ